ncbi:MAG: hypothetical protein IT371_10265 [Deltaproteobacteria bacterium]|nr:hypothetical protein [Deltaproteobacteria bacterium]
MEVRLDSPADQAVLSALRGGQLRQAASLLIRNHSQAVYAACRYLTDGAEAAEELAYRTFTEAVTELLHLRLEGSLRDWLLGVARGLALPEVRARLYAATGDEPVGTPRGATYPPGLTPDLLRVAIEELPVPLRVALALRYGHGLARDAVAAALDAPRERIDAWIDDGVGQLERRLRLAQCSQPGVHEQLLDALRHLVWRQPETLPRRLEALVGAL